MNIDRDGRYDTGVTLQISLAPTDLPHAVHILPHQLRQWARQMDEILLVLDLHRSSGRYATGWKERLPGIRQLLEACKAEVPSARLLEVDYSANVAQRLSFDFLGGHPVPTKDWIGAPFYGYLFALSAASHRYIFHMDSDMLYGGGSQTWVREALQLLREHEHVLSCSPLPGPPTTDGTLRSQTLERVPYSSIAYSAPAMSSRLFLIDLTRFRARIGHLTLGKPPRLRVLQALADGNPPYLAFEDDLSRAMEAHGLVRVDFLGSDPGMWAIHPAHRTPTFYQRLPDLVREIESGDIPDGQRGFHDVTDSLVDWSGARKPLWRRVGKHSMLAFQHAASLALRRGDSPTFAGLSTAPDEPRAR